MSSTNDLKKQGPLDIGLSQLSKLSAAELSTLLSGILTEMTTRLNKVDVPQTTSASNTFTAVDGRLFRCCCRQVPCDCGSFLPVRDRDCHHC